MISVSAPGKVHLIGEHSVVYGEPAILASVGLRCFIKAEKNININLNDKKLKINIQVSNYGLKEFTKNSDALWKKCFKNNDFSEMFNFLKKDKSNPIKAMLGKVFQKLNIRKGITLTINSDIPVASGLGSSSALAVALTKVVAEIYEITIKRKTINKIAFECEKFNHGTPSGGDNSTSCYGGLIWFQKPNTIISLKNEIPYMFENFVLVYTKNPEKTTGELVQMVKNLDKSYRNKRIKNLGKATKEMKFALIKKDIKEIKKLINFADKNLSELGLSIPETEKISKKVKKINGAAKMCGSCYGGVMLCYHENKDLLIQTIKKLGFNPIDTYLGVQGVRLEC
jgi:mevalonate kinase